MTEALQLLCVLVVGAILGALLLAKVALCYWRDATFAGSALSSCLLHLGLRHDPHRCLSTVDDEQRLVLIPIDRLCQSIAAQVPLWCERLEPHPAERIHLDPPEGSS